MSIKGPGNFKSIFANWDKSQDSLDCAGTNQDDAEIMEPVFVGGGRQWSPSDVREGILKMLLMGDTQASRIRREIRANPEQREFSFVVLRKKGCPELSNDSGNIDYIENIADLFAEILINAEVKKISNKSEPEPESKSEFGAVKNVAVRGKRSNWRGDDDDLKRVIEVYKTMFGVYPKRASGQVYDIKEGNFFPIYALNFCNIDEALKNRQPKSSISQFIKENYPKKEKGSKKSLRSSSAAMYQNALN